MGKRKRRLGGDEEIVDVVLDQTPKSTEDWFEKNKNLVLGLFLGLALLIAAFVIYKYFIKAPKEEAAKAAIFRAEQQFQRDSFLLALEKPGGGHEGFLDIVDNYGGTKTGNLAKLYAGICYLQIGKYEESISYLESHKSSGEYSPIVKNGNLGDAYSEIGDLGKALSFYEKATTSSEDALLTPYYLHKLGMLAKRNGDNSKAVSAFTKIKDNYPTSNEAANIDMLIGANAN